MKSTSTKLPNVLPVEIALPPPRAAEQFEFPFQNPDLPAEQRIDNLLGLLTLEEKIVCLGTDPTVPRLGIKACGHVEGLHGLAKGGPSNWGAIDPAPSTIFPQSIGLGQTWDPELVREVAAAEAYETRYIFQCPDYARGGLIVRAPNADLGRDPRWGRTEECFGEDAYFNGTMVGAFVRGLQGDHPRYLKTASLLKHFLANSNEDGRESSSSDFDERLLHEYYAVPFRMGILDAGAPAFMAAYNSYNGIPCTVHPILRDITMRQWGLDGIICTDGGALKLLITDHQYYETLAEGAAWAVKCGITQFLDDHVDAVREAIEKCYLTEAEIDAALRRNFRVMIRLGLLDPPQRVPYAGIGLGGEPEPWLDEKQQALALRATRKSIVLLKNDRGTLPLDRAKIRSIAVIGPRADEVLLDWYSGTPPYLITPLRGIAAKVGPNVRVEFARDNTDGAAVRLAASCDVAIVCVGNHPTCNAGWAQSLLPSDGKEAVDRKSLTLEDEALVHQVLEANPSTVMVLQASFPYAINWSNQNVAAIVQLTHCSQETGTALADVLFGDFNPAGRLVQTWPRRIDDLPPMLDYNLRNGRTYLYSKAAPLYPFGYGLSYTTFEYSRLRTSGWQMDDGDSLAVLVDVTNSGTRAGEEVVQLYARYISSDIERPIKQLVDFCRIALSPGQTKTAQLRLGADQLAYWDVSGHRFVVEPGTVEIQIGASSADIRLTTHVHTKPSEPQ